MCGLLKSVKILYLIFRDLTASHSPMCYLVLINTGTKSSSIKTTSFSEDISNSGSSPSKVVV